MSMPYLQSTNSMNPYSFYGLFIVSGINILSESWHGVAHSRAVSENHVGNMGDDLSCWVRADRALHIVKWWVRTMLATLVMWPCWVRAGRDRVTSREPCLRHWWWCVMLCESWQKTQDGTERYHLESTHHGSPNMKHNDVNLLGVSRSSWYPTWSVTYQIKSCWSCIHVPVSWKLIVCKNELIAKPHFPSADLEVAYGAS